jgi:hypothetical protein
MMYVFGLLFYFLSWVITDHYRPWPSFHSEALAFLSLNMLTLGISHWGSTFKLPAHITAAVGFCGVLIAIQFLIGITPFAGDVLVSLVYMGSFLAAIGIGSHLNQSTTMGGATKLTYLVQVFCLSAATSALIGTVQWLQINGPWDRLVVQTEIGSRAAGNIAQPNQLATLLLMGLSAMVYLHLQAKWRLRWLLVCCSLMSFALVLAQSRTAVLSVACMAVFIYFKRNLFAPLVSFRWVLVWLCGFALATLILPSFAHFMQLDSARDMSFINSSSERFVIWKQTLHAIEQSPWLGYGWNHTTAAHAAGAIAQSGNGTFTYAHNIFLDLFAWCGIPIGLLLVGTGLYWFFRRAFQITSQGAACAFLGLIPLAVHSCFEFPFAYAYFLLIGGVFIGTVESSLAPTKYKVASSAAVWTVSALCLPLGGWLIYEYLLIEKDFAVVRFESMKVGKTPTEYEPPTIILLNQMGTLLKAARIPATPHMSQQDLTVLKDTAYRFSIGNLDYRYALALALNGETAEARNQMRAIKGMYGDKYYQTMVQELRDLQRTKYPALAALID